MSSVKEKVLLGIGGTVGVSIAAWRGFFPWIGYDIPVIKKGKQVAKMIEDDLENSRFLIDLFETSVNRVPKRTCLIFEDRLYTYEFINKQACKVANAALSLGLRFGDTAIMFMHNEPAFLWTLLGFMKIGVVISLLNTNIKKGPLLHCINTSEAKLLVVGKDGDLEQAIEDIKVDITVNVYLMGLGFDEPRQGYHSWDQSMLTASSSEISKTLRSSIEGSTPVFYMFTSGTTGLPKPGILDHRKCLQIGRMSCVLGVVEDDILYCTLPLYHMAGCGSVLLTCVIGATVVIQSKFSAHHFFDNCRRYNVTVIQYIGELCRYLLALPQSPKDKDHKVRLAFGNGLRMDIWEKFMNRFNIKQVIELYGATEGVSFLSNISGKIGSIGRISPLLRRLSPYGVGIVKYDKVKDGPLRDDNNRCIPVNIGEPGLLLQGIPPTTKRFYKGSAEINERKIVRNAFVEGDEYFDTGDLVYMDKDYFVYFTDRMGDTFRWKGENVSTTEVANVISALGFLQDANVYGVTVPGHDGRAGMAALHLKETEQLTADRLKQIYKHCEKNLPSYARPLFLRIEKKTRITTTFKQHKVDLVKEGFDPNVIPDQLFYVSDEIKTYLPLDGKSYNNLIQSKL